MTVKKTLKIASVTVIVLIGVLAVYFTAAFSLSRLSVNADVKPIPEIDIYIMTNGVHTDIAVPVANELIDWRKEIKFADTKSADTNSTFLAMGWGDRKFYLETPEFSDLKFSTAVNAVFGLGKSAVHTTYYTTVKEDKQCKKIRISKVQYQKLVTYLSNSFERTAEGHIKNIATTLNYDNSDAFYEGVGSYSMFKTCNTWANSALKYAGLKACYWTIFDTGIFLKYQ
ncbi:TIGR02117 family protein [Pedobacter sp. AW1-32]|uniref:TIGR02117 family protein n=1 Tax=Pedobacter sp. AW1-32 TaxID=3383026 RepID=UPI003FEE4B17